MKIVNFTNTTIIQNLDTIFLNILKKRKIIQNLSLQI